MMNPCLTRVMGRGADVSGVAITTHVTIVPQRIRAPSDRPESDLSDSNPPDLWTLLQVIPGELAGVLCFELVTERLRVMVIDQHKTLA